MSGAMMIEEQVQVVAIEGDQLLLEAQTQSACGACAAKKGCGTAVLSKVVGKKFTRFQARNTVDARIGDIIVVGLPETALLRGSLMIYLLPLLGMIGMALLVDAILAFDAEGRDLSIAIAAMAGFTLSLLAARRYFSSSASRATYTPVILRKIIQ